MKEQIIILGIIALIVGSCGGRANNNQQFSNTNDMTEKVNITGHWKTDGAVVGLDILDKRTKTDEYALLRRMQEEDSRNGFFDGWQVEFKSDETFECFERFWDGLADYFHIAGTYKYMDANHIRIGVHTIEAQSVWGNENGTFELNGKELGVFLIDSIDGGFRLIRCMDGETDKQRIACSDMLRSLPSINAVNWRIFNWVKLDPHNRNTDNQKILNKGLAADGRYAPDKAKLLYTRNLDGEIIAFVFRYEKQNLIALYSRGPEVFAIYDLSQPLIEPEDEDEDYG
jgi:hypothetical protein